MAYQVLTFKWSSGYDDHLAGRPRTIIVCDWDERDLDLSFDKLKAIKPAYAEFYIGTHQHLVAEKTKFALALCKSLNEHAAATAALEVKV